jgi:hypothetical protein
MTSLSPTTNSKGVGRRAAQETPCRAQGHARHHGVRGDSDRGVGQSSMVENRGHVVETLYSGAIIDGGQEGHARDRRHIRSLPAAKPAEKYISLKFNQWQDSGKST